MAAAQPGKSVDVVLNDQAGAILSKCVTLTPKSSKAQKLERARKSAARAAVIFPYGWGDHVEVPVDAKGFPLDENVPAFAKIGGKTFLTSKWRLVDSTWARVLALAEERKAWRESRQAELSKLYVEAWGLAKRSWVEAGRALRIAVKAPAYALRANYKGNTYANQSDGRRETGQSPSVTMIVSNPYLLGGTARGVNGGQIMTVALNGRAKSFFTAMSKAKAGDIGKIVAKYAGMKMK